MANGDARALRHRLESLEAAGVLQIPRAGDQGGAPRVAPAASPLPGQLPPSTRAGSRDAALAVIAAEVEGCTRCAELAATRTRTVFGAGPPDARICFFGEAPGADEDASGLPFVGRAGELLTRIIEACRLRREDVYILNVLKCRPPGNRTPGVDEVSLCRGYFERQFEIIAPEYICCLGTTAAQALLQTTESIGRLRKRWFQYGAAKVICTYHPSYLLRNPAAKRDVWDDMKAMMADLGVNL